MAKIYIKTLILKPKSFTIRVFWFTLPFFPIKISKSANYYTITPQDLRVWQKSLIFDHWFQGNNKNLKTTILEKAQGNLVRTLTLGIATVLVISSVIGTGVYKKIAVMSNELGSPWLVLLCWLLAGLISLFGALSNAEIAGMMADSGGEYVYFKRIYGRFVAFIYGWSTFTAIKTASIASIAYVFSQSFNSLIPLPHLPAEIENLEVLWIFKPFDSFGVKALTILLILVLTYINTRGVSRASLLSSYITKLVIVGLSLIVVSGLLFSGGSLQNLQTNIFASSPQNLSNYGLIAAFFSAMLAAFWAYEGWNTLGFIGGEIQNPNRNVPLAFFGGMMVIIAAYLLVNFTYFYVLPIDEFVKVHQAKNDIAAVAVIRSYAGEIGAVVLSLLILITTLGCTNSTILMPPRIYYAMAKDGLFFPQAAQIHPRYHTPNHALWIQGIWACILVLSGSFDQLTDMLIFAAFFFYGATALGVFVLRVREPKAERPYKVWGYPVVPALFIVFCVSLIVITLITHPREAGIGLGLMFTGLPFYAYWNRKR
ncbi:MAG: amino acid permease [Microscillaceae bacterium]|jgi:APA family basic amino acid/polyamine antiporter|nr:amino acid permease [Microscillaceae bacterium]